MFLSEGCFGATNDSFSYINVPSDLFGKRAVAFRMTYVNGTVVCDSKRKINSLWGYVFSVPLHPYIFSHLLLLILL